MMTPHHTRTKSNHAALRLPAARGLYRAAALALAAMLFLGAVPPARTFAQSATPQTGSADTQTGGAAAKDKADDDETAGLKVKLYYFRDAAKLVTLLNAIASPNDSELHGLVSAVAAEDEVILYGNKKMRNQARRILAAIDLPRPGVNMEMWGIQISSRKPEKMAQVMPLIRAEVDRTQQAVRATYAELQRLTLEVIPDGELNAGFYNVLVNDLGYKSSLDSDRPLSFADILLRMIAAQHPGNDAAAIATNLDVWLRTSSYHDYAEELRGSVAPSAASEAKRPFERFFGVRGLQFHESGRKWEPSRRADASALQGRVALLKFALNYGRLVHWPRDFDAYSLQQSADALNTRLQNATDAINADMQDLFVEPTLKRIERIVARFDDVEYAQVGKVSVASLSGIATAVTSKSVNAFDVTPPLRLSELLAKAKTVTDSVTPFVPKPADNVVGAMPLSQVIGLIGAFGEERSVWRELNSGVSVTITPNVLRNMNSAELKIDLKTGDPQGGTRESGVRPLTRVSQHDVATSIYVNALDFFDLSAFASQSTLNGGRGYVPVIGPVWKGLFGEIPVAGKLFSWSRDPQTVYSESLILTNSFITPTAMGVAVLYPTELTDENGEKMEPTVALFKCQGMAVKDYEASLRVK